MTTTETNENVPPTQESAPTTATAPAPATEVVNAAAAAPSVETTAAASQQESTSNAPAPEPTTEVVNTSTASTSTTTTEPSTTSTTTTQPAPSDSHVFRDPKYPKGPLLSNHPDIWSQYTMLKTMTLVDPKADLLGHRAFIDDEPNRRGEYVWQTREQILERVHRTASGIKDLAAQRLSDKKQLIVGFLVKSGSRPDWHVIAGATSLIGAVMVPYGAPPSLAPEELAVLMAHSETNIMFCSADKVELVAKTIALLNKEQTVAVVAMDSFSCEPKQLKAMEDAGHRCWDIKQSELEARGTPFACCAPAAPDDDGLFIYTSGTTGAPKCVVLSMRSVIAGSVALYARVPEVIYTLVDLTYMSFLPQSHVFGIFIDTAAIRLGAKIGYTSGEINLLSEDIAKLRPLALAFVPRVYNKIYEGIMAKLAAAPWYKRAAFWAAYNWKKTWLMKGLHMHDCWADKLIFKEIRQKLGGRLVLMINGGAPIYSYVGEFFRVVCCDLFMEGYGMSETSACGMSRREEDGVAEYGHCGLPYCNTEIKLRSVPELGYDANATPARGELLIKSLHGFKRYHKDPEQTKQVLDDDGWIHTGDVAEITENGNIKVVDRIKQLFKLSQGEYVSVECIERAITKSMLVEDVFVTGNSLHRFPVAVVVPRKGNLTAWAKSPESGVDPKIADNFEQLCKTEQANKLIMSEVTRLCKEDALKGFMHPAAVYLDHVTFEAANKGLITASFKLKRSALNTQYAAAVEQLLTKVPI